MLQKYWSTLIIRILIWYACAHGADNYSLIIIFTSNVYDCTGNIVWCIIVWKCHIHHLSCIQLVLNSFDSFRVSVIIKSFEKLFRFFKSLPVVHLIELLQLLHTSCVSWWTLQMPPFLELMSMETSMFWIPVMTNHHNQFESSYDNKGEVIHIHIIVYDLSIKLLTSKYL